MHRAEVKRPIEDGLTGYINEVGLSGHKWPKFDPGSLENREAYLFNGSRKIAERFLRDSSTFTAGVISDSIKLTNTTRIKPPYSWGFAFEFQSQSPSYMNKTGQSSESVVKNHSATVVVDMGDVKGAVIDNQIVKVPGYLSTHIDCEVVDMVLQVISQAEKDKDLAEQPLISNIARDDLIEKYMNKFRTIGWGQKFDKRVIKELKIGNINIDKDERIIFSKSFGFWSAYCVEYSIYADLKEKKYTYVNILVGTDSELIIGSSLTYKEMFSCLSYRDITEAKIQNFDLYIYNRKEIIKCINFQKRAQAVLADFITEACKLYRIGLTPA